MTQLQELHAFVHFCFIRGSVTVTNIDNCTVAVTDRNGATMKLTIDDDGNFRDADTNQIYQADGQQWVV